MKAMDCDEAKLMLAGYADGELATLENEGVAAHLEQCGRCRQIVHDQQRIRHVLDSYEVPPVADSDWSSIGKALKAELEGKGEPIQTKTRPRIEGLEPTPEVLPPIVPEEPPPPAPRAREAPAPRPAGAAVAARTPAVTLLKVRPRKASQPFRWVAHVAGAAAASLVMALGLAALWTQAAPPLAPNTLARQGDVAIMELETNYSVILCTGDTDDVVALWVEPDESKG